MVQQRAMEGAHAISGKQLRKATAARTEPRVDLGLGRSEVAAKRATWRATCFPRTAGRRSPPKHHETPTSAQSSQLHPERRRVSGAVPRGAGVALLRRRFAACQSLMAGTVPPASAGQSDAK